MRLGPTEKKVLVQLLPYPLVAGGFRDLTYDAAHGTLRRLEDRMLVRRITEGNFNKWELTHEGRRWAETLTMP